MTKIATPFQTDYRGVSCSLCGEIIPISSTVRTLNGEYQTFALRCPACDNEGIYTSGHIHNIEGEPKPMRFDFLNGKRLRAANG